MRVVSVSSVFVLLLPTVALAGPVAPDPEPTWVSERVFVNESAGRRTLYGVGRAAVSTMCSPLATRVAVSIAEGGAHNAIGLYLGKGEVARFAAYEHGESVVRVENEEGKRVEPTVRTTWQRATNGEAATTRHVAGVRVLRAWYDAEARLIYVLAAKVITDAAVDLGPLPTLATNGGLNLRQAELQLRHRCRD